MLVRFLITFIALGLLAGCAPRGKVLPAIGSPTKGTGYEKQSESGARTAYTISGNPEVYRELRSEFEGKSPAMARAIEKVSVSKKATDQYEVNIKFSGNYFGLEELTFNGKLTTEGQEKKAELTKPVKKPSNYRPRFQLNIRCRSLDCKMMEMRLYELTGQYFRAEAIWIYQERETKARIIESDQGGVDALKIKQSDLKSTQTSVVIVQGPSYSEVLVTKKDAKPGDAPIMQVRTDLVNTEAEAENVQSISVNGDKDSYKAVLDGNQSETGDIMFKVEDKDGEGSTRIVIEAPRADNRGPQRLYIGIGEGRLDPNGISPEIDEYTKKLDAYAGNPQVDQRVSLWLSRGRACSGCRVLSRDKAMTFLTNLQAVTPLLLEASEMTNVSPEKAYILAIESAFLTNDTFPIQVSQVSNSSASGPWQLLTGTAQEAATNGGYPYTVFRLNGKTLNANDDRRYFFESTVMAFEHISRFPRGIRHDPGLELAGYYQGQNGVNRLASRYGGSNVSFDDLVKFNAFTRGGTNNTKDVADYVYSVISLRFLGMNPTIHDMDVPELTEVPAALAPKMRNPNR